MPIGTRTTPNAHWQDWGTLVLGVWLFAAPWVMNYVPLQVAAWNSWIFGAVIAVLSIAALVQFARWEEWLNAAIGLWLLISPWALGIAAPENRNLVWNFMAVGIVVGALALWEALTSREPPRLAV